MARTCCALNFLWCTHCQTWERAISAVATSSIRLKIAAAPVPRSHDSRYCIPTLTLLRRPPSVISAPGTRTSIRSLACTRTSSRRRPRRAVEPVRGLAALVPPPFRQRDLVDLRIAPAGDEGRHASQRMRSPPVAGVDEQQRVGAHERYRHRHLCAG